MSKHIEGHTPAPLTHEPHGSGKNWWVATCDFGIQPDGRHVILDIVTDHMHGSDVRYGEPEADVRLWSAAPELLAALEAMVECFEIDEEACQFDTHAWWAIWNARQAIERATKQQQQVEAPGIVDLSAGALEVVA